MREVSRREFLRSLGGTGVSLLSVGSLGTLLSACTGAQVEEGDDGGTLIIGLNSDVPTLDPHRTLGWTTMIATMTMGENLVTQDLTEVVPGPPRLVGRLAESHELSDDGLTYTFHLREGVTFHDGTPFDAAAVEFNIRRQWDESFEFFFEPAAGISFWHYQFLEEVRTPDPATVELVLSQPWPEFLRMNAQSWGQQFMISPSYVREVGNDEVGTAPVMTGPYRFKERVPGERIEVERNPEYWGPQPPMQTIIFRPMPDVAARISAVTSGQIDIAQDPLPWTSKEEIEESGAQITTAEPPHLVFMSLNLRDEATGNVLVRQAIEMGINKQRMVDLLYGDWASPAHSMLPANSPSYDPGFQGRPHDPEQASDLLAEAGYPDGFETRMLIHDAFEDIATVIQRDLGEIGITVVLDQVDFATFGGQWAAGLESPQTMTFASWGMTADYWIDIMTRSTRQPPDGTNIAWYSNPRIDELLDQAQVELTENERRRLYREVGEILHEDVPHVPLLNFGQPVAAREGVSGLVRPNENWFDPTVVSIR